jgi:hypothetical protein
MSNISFTVSSTLLDSVAINQDSSSLMRKNNTRQERTIHPGLSTRVARPPHLLIAGDVNVLAYSSGLMAD